MIWEQWISAGLISLSGLDAYAFVWYVAQAVGWSSSTKYPQIVLDLTLMLFIVAQAVGWCFKHSISSDSVKFFF